MPQFLCCPFCRSPTHFTRADNATYVFNGEPVCHRPLCKEKAVSIAQTQTNQKCREFGMAPFYPEARPFPRYAGAP